MSDSRPTERSADTEQAERSADTEQAERSAGTGHETSVHGLLVQAPIAPLDENGIVVTTVGTAAFAVAAVVLGLQYGRLAAAGDGWWLWVAITGVVLGLIGLSYCWLRRSRRSPNEN
jgi:hypothetical protein